MKKFKCNSASNIPLTVMGETEREAKLTYQRYILQFTNKVIDLENIESVGV